MHCLSHIPVQVNIEHVHFNVGLFVGLHGKIADIRPRVTRSTGLEQHTAYKQPHI